MSKQYQWSLGFGGGPACCVVCKRISNPASDTTECPGPPKSPTQTRLERFAEQAVTDGEMTPAAAMHLQRILDGVA